MATKAETEKLYTVAQVAERSGFAPRTIRALLESGRLVGIRPTGPTGHWRVTAAEVDRLLSGRLGESIAPTPRSNLVEIPRRRHLD